MTKGCDEKIDLSYLKWLWNFPKIKKKIIITLENNKDKKKIYNFKNRGETKRFIKNLT